MPLNIDLGGLFGQRTVPGSALAALVAQQQSIPQTAPVNIQQSILGAIQQAAARQGNPAAIAASLRLQPQQLGYFPTETGTPQIPAFQVQRTPQFQALLNAVPSQVPASNFHEVLTAMRGQQPDQSLTVENVLVNQYRQGKMTLDELLAAKRNLYPEGVEFAGTDAQGNPVIMGRKTGTFRAGQLPQGTGGLRPTVAPTVPAAEAEKLSGFVDLSRNVRRVRQAYDSRYVGLLNAPLGQIQQRTGFGAEEKRAVFVSALRNIQDVLLRLRSGAAINEQEYQRLLKIAPDDRTSVKDFEARFKLFEDEAKQIILTRKDLLKAAGYRMDDLIAVLTQPAAPKAARFKELTTQGLSKEQAFSVMTEEGYR